VAACDIYVTNGVFLYRITGPFEHEDDWLVDVEDCYSLDVVRVPVADVIARKLRVVIPGRSETAPFGSRQEHSRIATISRAAT
jgi:hypothetical protein